MSTSESLVLFQLAGEVRDEMSMDTLPGKFTVTGTNEALTPYADGGGGQPLASG